MLFERRRLKRGIGECGLAPTGIIGIDHRRVGELVAARRKGKKRPFVPL